MDLCTVETGLLRKKPCGQPSVTRCLNCEQALCSKHAVAQLNEAGHKTGKFLCKECHAAQADIAKNTVTRAAQAAAAAHAPAKKPDAPPAAAPAKPAAAAAKPVPGKAAPKEAPKEAPAAKPAENTDGSIDFTPSKK